MDFLELARQRQSVRGYIEKPVEPDKIDRCIEAARLAPSACNSQPWKFIVINDPQVKKRVAEETFGKVISFNHFSMQAPVLVAIVGERQKMSAKFGAVVKRKDFSLMDIAIAAEHFCLQAVEEEIGTCMLGWFNTRKVGKLLGVPRHKQVKLIITAGYPKNTKIRPKIRKKTDQMRSFNTYKS